MLGKAQTIANFTQRKGVRIHVSPAIRRKQIWRLDL